LRYKPKDQVLTWEHLAFGWARHSAFNWDSAFTKGSIFKMAEENSGETQLTNAAP